MSTRIGIHVVSDQFGNKTNYEQSRCCCLVATAVVVAADAVILVVAFIAAVFVVVSAAVFFCGCASVGNTTLFIK